MQQIVILGGGAAGMAAALAAAQAAGSAARITLLDRNPRCGKKLLATGNGRCNLDNTGIAPECYFTADPKALAPLLAAVERSAPLEWFRALGLYTRTDEAGRVYPYSNQAADVLALLEGQMARLGVEVRTGCTVNTISQNRNGYTVLFDSAEHSNETLHADAVICALGGNAGPQFGTDGFGTKFAAQCGGKLEPLYPCLTALQVAKPNRSLAGIRAKAAASLLDLDRHTTLAAETGEVQFTEYGLSGICIMQLSGLLAPKRGPKRPAVELGTLPRAGRSGPDGPVRGAGVPAARQDPRRSLDGAAEPEAGQGALGRSPSAGQAPEHPARCRVAGAGQHRKALALRGADPLRMETGPDHRRRSEPDRAGTQFSIQGLPRPLLCGRNAGLRRNVRRLQPPLGLRQRHHRRAGRGALSVSGATSRP